MHGAVTEASLVGTIGIDGTEYKGLLTRDTTICTHAAQYNLIERILPYLKAGRVHKTLIGGVIDYEIKAKLILIMSPFVLTKEMKEVFDVVEPRLTIKPIR